MSMIEDMTKQMQNLRDEHKQQLDEIKGVSRTPTNNKFEIYQQISYGVKPLIHQSHFRTYKSSPF